MARPARGSIRRQLPGLMVLVVSVAILVFGAVAYNAVRRSEIAAADLRLDNLASQFSAIFGNSFASILDSARVAASDSAVADRLTGRGPADRSGVRSALTRLGPIEGAVLGVELRRAGGGVVYALGDTSRADRRSPAALARSADGEPVVGSLYTVGDTVLVQVHAPVIRDGELLGQVVQRRSLVTTPEAVRTITQLMGPDAALLVGNADGSVWSDLVRAVDRPPPAPGPLVYTRDSIARRAASRPIPRTPLEVAVEFPQANVLSLATDMLWRFSWLAVLIVAIVALAGWLLGRRITDPLAQLADAAGRISGGDLDATATATSRHDEIGTLAHAFNVMADSVRRGHDTLEEQVAERTAELEGTLAHVRELQDELVRKERLATLGQLSSSVGHELRNPLGVMTNAVYYLERVLTDAPPKVVEYLALLGNEVRTCEKIVSDLLDFARIKPPQKQIVGMGALVDQQLERVSIPTEIRVDRKLGDALPAVKADPGQVGQVLLNVITNAVQAMEEEGGVLTISASTVDTEVHLEVSDTGPGVPQDIRTRIFEPLYTTRARGIGLGLSVSRALARANGGDLRLAGRGDGDGATFVIELPGAVAST